MKSWYPIPKLLPAQIKYCKTLQQVFKVQDAGKQWVEYNLTPHQLEWHKSDVSVMGEKARNRVVIKSRNTSFTTSAMISNLTAVYHFPEQQIPFVRLTARRAEDLIEETKNIIRRMTPVKIGGELYPFNPEDVNMDSVGKIVFPNKVRFQAYPANHDAAELIRGLRITGSAGIIDEANFMRDFYDIFISSRDAASGFVDGEKTFQMNIGSTLKGQATPFKIFYDKHRADKSLDFFYWHVFDPSKFNPEKSILEQDLVPIVPWHSVKDLEEKRFSDIRTFMEEYMCVVGDSDDVFYRTELVISVVDLELKNNIVLENSVYVGGCDVASINDYFVITLFDVSGDVSVQKFLYYKRDVELNDMQDYLFKVLPMWIEKGLKRFRIDKVGIGLQLFQNLRKKFGSVIEGVNGGARIKSGKMTVGLNEFGHTNLKNLMVFKKILLLNDELQFVHFGSWNYLFKCESSSEYGHGDIVMAIMYALLPVNWRVAGQEIEVATNIVKEEEKKEDYSDWTLKDKISWFKKGKK